MNPKTQMTSDYHDIATIDMPQSERRRLGIGDIWVNAATCNTCGERIRSRNRHDFVTCSCGKVSVDGGSWYVRRVGEPGSFTSEVVSFTDIDNDA